MPSSLFSRRTFLQKMGMAPVLLHVAPLDGGWLFLDPASQPEPLSLTLGEFHLRPRYPAKSPLEDVLRLVPMGSDEFITEKYAFEIEQQHKKLGESLRSAAHDLTPIASYLESSVTATPLTPLRQTTLRSSAGIETQRIEFGSQTITGRDEFLKQLRNYFQPAARILTAQFDVVSLNERSVDPLELQVGVRYDFVFENEERRREERIGQWQTRWVRDASNTWQLRALTATQESRSTSSSPAFIDISEHALG